MTSLLLAIQFLTTLPLKIDRFEESKIARALIFFPAVGFLLGFALVVLNSLLGILGVPSLAINITLVVFLIILTGGMHLDGLSDTADALLSGKSKKEMLDIMRDPHIGVMGVLSLISIILLKFALLISIGIAIKPVALFLMCILSRWSVVLVMYLFPYARSEGKAKLFIQGLDLKIFTASLFTVFALSLAVWGIKGILTLMIISGCAYLINRVISGKLGGITGDTLGATIELTEVVTLFIVCL